MLMSINDEIVEVADQTTDERILLPEAVELARAAEQLVHNGFVMQLARGLVDTGRQRLRVCGRGGERT
jgi:thiazole synthase ThiGH ThiG subunit